MSLLREQYVVITRKDIVITRKICRYKEKRSRYYEKRPRYYEKICHFNEKISRYYEKRCRFNEKRSHYNDIIEWKKYYVCGSNASPYSKDVRAARKSNAKSEVLKTSSNTINTDPPRRFYV